MSTKLHAPHSSWLRAFLVLVLAALPHRASGADYTVTDCTDGASSTTLRGLVNFLISEASENKSIDASGCATITLSQGEIRVPISLTILGGGSGEGDGTTIDANLASRAFSSFDGNMNGFNKTLTLVGLNIVHGRHATANSLPAHGGCIDVLNAVVLQDSVVSDCAATTTLGQAFGGAINAGYVTLTHSRVEGGVASSATEEADGGGIRASLGFTCTQSSISGNQASSAGANYGYGGGLHSGFDGTLNQCTIDSNSAAVGGGIFFANDLSLIDSTVSGNSATTAGTGGIEGAALTIANSTITNNFGYCGGVNTGTITMNGMIKPTGPFIRKPRPSPTAASTTNFLVDRSDSSVETNAAQIASVMQNVSGRSGSDIRPIAK